MFRIPDPPSYRFVYEEWRAYRDLLVREYADADGIGVALDEANIVVEFLEQERANAQRPGSARRP